VPDDLLLVAPPRILELLRGALGGSEDLNMKSRRHEEIIEPTE
jgi:hypothetical protein